MKALSMLAVLSAATLAAGLLSFNFYLSSAQEQQDACPFYLPDCSVTRGSSTAEQEPPMPNITAIINTASITLQDRGAHLEFATEKVNGTQTDISQELVETVEDVERDETLLFIVDRASNETLQFDDLDVLTEELSAKVGERVAESTSLQEGEEMLSISVLQLVDSSSRSNSSLTVDMQVLNVTSPDQSALYGHSAVSQEEYPGYAACWLGYMASSALDSTSAMDAQDVCLEAHRD